MTIAASEIFNKRNYLRLSLLLLNAVALVFVVVNACVLSQSTAADVFTAIMLIVFALDAVYGMRSNNKLGGVLILCITLLGAINGAALMVAGLSAFRSSISVVAILALTLIPLLSSGLIVLDMLKPSEKPQTFAFKGADIVRTALLISLPMLQLILAFLGYDLLFGGTTSLNGFTAILGYVLIFLIFGSFVFYLRLIRESARGEGGKATLKCNIAAVALTAVLTAFALTAFVTAEASHGDTRAYLSEAFSERIESTEFRRVKRARPHSLCSTFFGIRTDGYKVEKDVEYFVSDREIDRGLSLKYDVYYPSDERDTSIIVNIHGGGGDKDLGNYAHRNKYFASLGYVVYDIQIGDINEKGANAVYVYDKVESVSEYFIANIGEFFKYIAAADRHGGNLDSVFVTGVSMGGSLALKIGLPMRDKIEAIGLTIRGILPIYPGYRATDNGIDDYLEYIDKDSVPCLVAMGMRDAVVSPETVYYIAEGYEECGNENYTSVIVEYGGHGMDASFTGRANQLITYYAERFIELHAAA